MKPAQVKPPISPELLNQIDIRVGTIESVSDVANSFGESSNLDQTAEFGIDSMVTVGVNL
jgi:hypothetical protein